MNLNLTNVLASANLFMKKNGPTIAIGAGTIGLVAAGIGAAVISYKKAHKIVDEHKKKIEQVNKMVEEGAEESKVQEEIGKTYISTGFEFLKAYAIPATAGLASVLLIAGGTKGMLNKQAALASALSVEFAANKKLRKALEDLIGKEEVIEKLYSSEKVEATTEITEDGTEVITKTENVLVWDGINMSQYAKVFDSTSRSWTVDPESNIIFLKHQQAVANSLLQKRGYLFLNEVYKLLDIKPTKAGQIVGWVYKKDNPVGDNYIDFGIYDMNNARAVNGLENVLLLDFNVDGNILDMI